MKNRLRKVIFELDAIEQKSQAKSALHAIDARAKLLVTLVYLIAMLSVKLISLTQILIFFIYPIFLSAYGNFRYGRVLKKSLVVLPFVLFIGVFNLFYNTDPLFRIGTLAVSQGVVEFISIILRGLLSVQALILLIESTGFYKICRAMQRLGVPSIFTHQLLFVYRYLIVMLQESLNISMAFDSRSFGQKGYPVKLWGILITQLLIKSYDKADLINKAMISRGFTGKFSINIFNQINKWSWRDTWFLVVWTIILLCFRFVPFVEMGSSWLFSK